MQRHRMHATHVQAELAPIGIAFQSTVCWPHLNFEAKHGRRVVTPADRPVRHAEQVKRPAAIASGVKCEPMSSNTSSGASAQLLCCGKNIRTVEPDVSDTSRDSIVMRSDAKVVAAPPTRLADVAT